MQLRFRLARATQTAMLVLALFVLSAAHPARAANCSSFPYTLTNGQVADATQVMANFNNVLNCANNNLAKNGTNSDITSLTGMVTPLSASQGGTGVTTGVGVDVYFFVGGLTGNAWTIGAYQPSTDVTLTNAKARCRAGTGATGTTTYTLKDNGSTIGTAVVTAGGTVCAATLSSSPTTVAAGHTITLTGPATGDATLADIGITFGGTRQ